jgi:hypothetical protein
MPNASSDGANGADLIAALAADLKPVRRLPPPNVRAVAWLAVVIAIAAALAHFSDLAGLARRLSAAPDMWLALIGSASTMILAAIAAFQLSLPDRSPAWAQLPLPAALLWIFASGAGCLRVWLVPAAHVASMGEAMDCLVFIVGFSVPLSALLIVMLRRAFSFAPGLTAAMAGLAAAAAAATLIVFVHPYDAGATDLLVHAFAVALVIVAARLVGPRFFTTGTRGGKILAQVNPS